MPVRAASLDGVRQMQKLVVVGYGAAGLAAALSAAEQAHSRGLQIEITLLEKAPEHEAGGNTRWSPSYIRMDAPDRLADGFEEDMQAVSGGQADRDYFHTLATNAVETIRWLEAHGVAFATPLYYLSTRPTRIQPVGGGAAIVEKLSHAAKAVEVRTIYEAPAKRLVRSEGRISGVEFTSGGGATAIVDAAAVVLATGGFQGNAMMMRQQFGADADGIALISPGTRFNTGDGIRMARDLGARASGDWNGMHIEPIDPRSARPAPVVLVYPYGIVVDQDGQRFFDEGKGLVHETWESFAREVHFARKDRITYAVLDSRLFDIEGFERAVRSDVAPYQSETIEGLAAQISVPAGNLRETIDAFNAASGDVTRFDAARCDGLATQGIVPAKSNWARPIAKPPYLAYPLVGGLAYTFGGLATNEKAEVIAEHGPVPGLYAAGEITGHFYGAAPNAVAVLRALVFGRIAGREAVGFLSRNNS
jgi:tricarballylate dehydrogenase